MKYLTYFEEVQGLRIYDVVGEDIVSSTSIVYKLNCYHGQVCIGSYENSHDFSSVSAQAVNFFGVQQHDLESLKIFVYSNSDKRVTVDVSEEQEVYMSITDKNVFDEMLDHIDSGRQPYKDWAWDDVRKHWKPPVEKPKLPLYLESSWDFTTESWIVSVAEEHLNRKNRSYKVWKSVPVESGHSYSSACSTTNYMIKSLEEITHSTNVLDSTVTSLETPGADETGVSNYPIVLRHEIVLDLSPIAIITYNELDERFIEKTGGNLWKIHPQCNGRTIHELFRLIIEWAWAYTELDNTEPTAEICHEILQAMQMPMSVRQELLALEPEVVGKYLLDDPTALEEDLEDPEQPPLFKSWLSEQYKTFKKRQSSDPIRVKYPLYDYDR